VLGIVWRRDTWGLPFVGTYIHTWGMVYIGSEDERWVTVTACSVAWHAFDLDQSTLDYGVWTTLRLAWCFKAMIFIRVFA